MKEVELLRLGADSIDDSLTAEFQRFIPIFGSSNQASLDTNRMIEIAEAQCNTFLLARDQLLPKRALGTATLTIYPTPTNNRAEITNIAVLPEARRAGVARLMLDECMAIANDALVNTVQLSTGTNNAAARSLFEHFGFSAVSLDGADLVEYEYSIMQGQRF